jgi:hypothetical protein
MIPKSVEIFGLKKPFPTIINNKDKYMILSLPLIASPKYPNAIKLPPIKIAFKYPIYLSAIIPPINGAK